VTALACAAQYQTSIPSPTPTRGERIAYRRRVRALTLGELTLRLLFSLLHV